MTDADCTPGREPHSVAASLANNVLLLPSVSVCPISFHLLAVTLFLYLPIAVNCWTARIYDATRRLLACNKVSHPANDDH